jgi:hypothetical protein
MSQLLYRYQFDAGVEMTEVESTLALAILATENLYGESQVRLDASHYCDAEIRSCVIDGSTAVGRDINRMFTGFLSREFGEDEFRVERLEHAGTLESVEL